MPTATQDDIYDILRGIAHELTILNDNLTRIPEATVWAHTYATVIAHGTSRAQHASGAADTAVRQWKQSSNTT